MKRLTILIFVLILTAAIAFPTVPAQAQPNSPNLLKDHNPGFEQGFLFWSWSPIEGAAPNYQVVSRPGVARCGTHTLKVTQSKTAPSLWSDSVSVTFPFKYELSIWAKTVDGDGDASNGPFIESIGSHYQDLTGYGLEGESVSERTTGGQWKKYSFLHSTVLGEKFLGLAVWYNTKDGGRVYFDCASIKQV